MLYEMIKKVGHFILAPMPDWFVIQLLYLWKFKRLCPFKKPVTFNDKINWRKLYQRDPRFPIFVDKYAVKNEIAKLIGEEYVVPMLWYGEKSHDIPFDKLEPPFVIKANNGCGDRIFIRKKEDIDLAVIHQKMAEATSVDYSKSHREWAYQPIKPMVLVEKMLLLPDGKVPNDFKFFVYKGRAHFVQFDTDRFEGHRIAFLDRDWNKLPFSKGYPKIEGDIPKPQHYDLMLNLAEKIGEQFDFARIDFYDLPTGVFFGEVTFYPAGGLNRFYPDEWDEIFGKPWVIEPTKMTP